MRRAEPKALIRTGIAEPSTFSKSNALFETAGPLATRSAMALISSVALTGALTRTSSPALSRRARNALKSR